MTPKERKLLLSSFSQQVRQYVWAPEGSKQKAEFEIWVMATGSICGMFGISDEELVKAREAAERTHRRA